MTPDLTQAEADSLLQLEKTFVDRPALIELASGTSQTHDLQGPEGRERFLLDLYRGAVRLSKVTIQARARRIVTLARLDLDGPRHTNPDGEVIECPHLHVYQEGYGDKWAHALDVRTFPAPQDRSGTFERFCHLVRIVDPPIFQVLLA